MDLLGNPTVTIFLDGKELTVPEHADCFYAAIGALGVPRGLAVAYEAAPNELLDFRQGHTFSEGDRYVIRDASVLWEKKPTEAWETDADAWKG